MKKFYAIALLSACAAMAGAQTEFTSDVTLDSNYSDNYDGNVVITNCTVTIGFEQGNTTALPFLSGETITLSEGGKVKFFDSPDTAYPEPEDGDWSNFQDATGQNITALPFNWVIDGDDNEIYLDSYCTMGGTISGTGTLTIYATKKNVINSVCYYKENADFPAFDGIIYFKTLDGYECDSLYIGADFRSGYYSADGVGGSFSFAANKMDIYAATSTILDVNALNNPYVNCSANLIPQIEGACTLQIPSSYTVMACAAVSNGYDAVIEGGGTASRFGHMTGGTFILNEGAKYNAAYDYFYNRSTSTMIINSKEPSFSNVTNISMRAAALFCGNGYVDTNLSTNSGRTGHYTAGDSAVGSVGTLTVRDLFMYQGSVIDVDFDNAGNADRLVIPGTMKYFSGRNDFSLRLPYDFFVNPKVQNYKVIDAVTYDADMKYLVDTIGFYFLDATGYYQLNPAGDTTWYSYTSTIKAAHPEAQLTEVSNREMDTLRVWSRGTYADGNDAYDDNYHNTVSADNYTPAHPWALGGAMEYLITDPDDWFYNAIDSLEAREVVPGCGDSVKYNGHSLGCIHGSSFGAYADDATFVGAFTFPYYYWSDNTVQLNGFKCIDGGSFVDPEGNPFNVTYKGTTDENPEEGGVKTFGMNAYTWPITRYNVEVELGGEGDTVRIDTVGTYVDWSTKFSPIKVPQTNGDTIWYWFDFKNIFTTGDIALCAQTHKADGTVEEEEDPSNNGASDIKTALMEKHAVASRVIRTADGRRVNGYQRGLNIVTTRYTDGTIETKKLFFAR